jgi:hypothetical protein
MGDGPDEGGQLASDGGGHHRRLLALARQGTETLAQKANALRRLGDRLVGSSGAPSSGRALRTRP